MEIKIAETSIAQEVASELLQIGAIKLNKENPFTWSSGWKSPIYCDNRMSLSYPKVRSLIKYYLSEIIKRTYPQAEAIAGVATAGIPQGALVAESLNLPFLYVRSKPKGHGMENMIEGKLNEGERIVLVEDLVSTGGSSLKAAEAIKAAGGEVLGMAAIFTYGFEIATENFQKAGIPLICLSNYEQMLPKAEALEYIKKEDLATLQEWRKSPETWGK